MKHNNLKDTNLKYLDTYIEQLQSSYKQKDKIKIEEAIEKLSSAYNTSSISKYISSYIKHLIEVLEDLDKNKIESAIEMLVTAYKNGNKIFILGNGGSASNASHMACDLGKGTLSRIYDDRKKRFKVYSLTDNVAIMSAIANDLSYDDIFVQQLRNLIEKDDVVIALSGSGNSINVIKAVNYARERQAKIIGFLGFKNGGKLAGMVDCAIIANSNEYGPCEDIQLVLDHMMTAWLARIRLTDDE
jgi:D-sedoheptulose 7-phosphate isomerase